MDSCLYRLFTLPIMEVQLDEKVNCVHHPVTGSIFLHFLFTWTFQLNSIMLHIAELRECLLLKYMKSSFLQAAGQSLHHLHACMCLYMSFNFQKYADELQAVIFLGQGIESLLTM